MSLVWAVPDRASRGWRGVTQTPAGLLLLQDLRHHQLDLHTTSEEKAIRPLSRLRPRACVPQRLTPEVGRSPPAPGPAKGFSLDSIEEAQLHPSAAARCRPAASRLLQPKDDDDDDDGT